ncbi:uncharacterized protein LOC121975883 [Zingiber officinale]|uniref:uncharacterized protein LOC121975883 n=1 Tax=Zingiber officinale TaxID=94328 RepID=UPI001C4B6754|nr:uncharacterized protein LOC121975883 [Zingiber officinale]
MGIRTALHPIEKGPKKIYLPPASFSMGKKEKSMFCKVLKQIKVPDGYASNISRCVQMKPPKLIGLKSHDNHILMQQLLPVALHRTLSKSVRVPLIRLSRYFRELCSKVISPTEMTRLRRDIAVILCELEKIFPPSFFDIMVHLTIHLATEVQLAGPVHYRWMYPIGRYLGTLKSYVRNRNRPEGSIAEGYLAEECLTFCSLYLADYVETRFNQSSRNDNANIDSTFALDVFNISGYALGKAIATKFDTEILKNAHQYVLFNCHRLQSYIDEHRGIVQLSHSRLPLHQIERIHSETFASWFANHIEDTNLPEDDPVSNDLRSLARGPNVIGIQYHKFVSNGFRFHTKEVERKRKTQNCGVTVRATTSSYSSIKDHNPVLSELDYYGILQNVIELDYGGGRKVALFECEWVSKGKRLKLDEDGFMLANFKDVRRHNEPYILASQAMQVFYVEDPNDCDWHVIITTDARAKYNMQPMTDVDTYLQSYICNSEDCNEHEEVVWVRDDIAGVEIDTDL